MSDILNSAKQHDWYAHDETLAEELIDEIERLREQGDVLKEQMAHWVAEDHRLRGVLRELLDNNWLISTNGFAAQRVREALGE